MARGFWARRACPPGDGSAAARHAGGDPVAPPVGQHPIGEHRFVFGFGIALTLGLLLTEIATFQAEVFPRPAALLLPGAMAGSFFVFFVAEFLPPAAGQIGSTVFGVLLAVGFAWIGVALWLRSPAT